MRAFEVGKLFEEGKTHYQECVKFDFAQGGPVLFLFYDKPTDVEIEDIEKGGLQIGIYAKDEVIFTLFKFGSQSWIDSPYSVHLSETFEFEEISVGMGFGLQILLIDAATGILKVIRYVGLSTRLSKVFINAVLLQKEKEFNNAKYNQKISQVYRNYSTKDLIDRADIIEKVGV